MNGTKPPSVCLECKRNTTLHLKVDVRNPETQGWEVKKVWYCNRHETEVRERAMHMGHIKR